MIKPNLWARKLFQETKKRLSKSWAECFNKTHKNHTAQIIENTSCYESGISDSDQSSDGEVLETDSESESYFCFQTKTKLSRIQQKKLLMCSAELNVKKMLEENGKDIDRYIKHFQSFLSSRKGK